MGIEVREVDDRVILDLHWPLAWDSDEERDESRRVAHEAGSRGKELVFVLHKEHMTSLDLGQFIGVVTSALSGQDRRIGWPIRVVIASERVREVFRITDSAFMAFESVEEALEWKPSGAGGCFTVAMLMVVTVIAALVLFGS